MKDKFILISILTVLLSSCELSADTNSSENTGLENDISKVKAQTFENIYIVDEKLCESKGLPATQFAVEYPNDLEVDTPNDQQNHIIIKKKVGNFVAEEFAISNSTLTLKNENLALELIESIVENLKAQLPDLEVISIGKKDFNGEMIYLFEGKVDYSQFEAQGYKGIYKLMFFLSFPKDNENLNAVVISFIANDLSEIKTFSDFANKGMIGEVYQTFRYIE